MMNRGYRLVLAGLIIYFLFFLVHVIASLIYPYDLDNEEGFILNQIRQLRQGHTIYPPLMDYPYTVGNYPPVYQILCVPFQAIFGDFHWIGRLVSILSSLFIGRLIYLIVKELKGDNISAWIAGLFPFSFHYFYRWAPYNRVDMLGLVLSLSGIYFILRNPKKFIIPLICFLLSVYTKPVLIAAPVSTGIYLLYRDRKIGTKYILILFISGISLFLLLNLLTRGGFYNHVVLYNANPYHVRDLWNYIGNLLRFYWIFIGFVFFSFFYKIKEERINLFFLYLILSILIGFGSGKEGSAVNYWIEPIIAGSILLGSTIAGLNRTLPSGRILIPFLLMIQILWIPHIPYTPLWYGTTPTYRDYEIGRSVERIVRQTDGDILSDDACLLVRTGKPVLFQPFIMRTLARQGLWDQNSFIRDIRSKKFSLVILYFPLRPDSTGDLERYTPDILQALKENYQITDYRPPYWIHHPIED